MIEVSLYQTSGYVVKRIQRCRCTYYQITGCVSFDNKVTGFTRVYAHTNYRQRQRLWFELLKINDPSIAQAVIGDFNCVLGSHEKRDGNLPSQISFEEFMAFNPMIKNGGEVKKNEAKTGILELECFWGW